MALVPGDNFGRNLAIGTTATSAAGLIAREAARQALRYGSNAAQAASDWAWQQGRRYWNTPRNTTQMKRARGNSTFTQRKKRRLAKQNARIGGLIGLEVKFKDTWVSQQLTDSNTLPEQLIFSDSGGVITHMTGVSQGSGESQRIGRNIFIRSMNIKVNIFMSRVERTQPTWAQVNGDLIGQTRVTVYMVMDKQCNSTTPTAAAIFTNPSGSISAGIYSYIAMAHGTQVEILT